MIARTSHFSAVTRVGNILFFSLLVCCFKAQSQSKLSACPADGSNVTIESRTYASGSFPVVIKRKSYVDQKVSAFFYRPSRTGELPAVVISLGSAGSASLVHIQPFIDQLRNEGYVVMIPDTNSARGFGNTDADPEKISFASAYADAYASFKYLSTLPCVKNDRIALLGYSRGGRVAIDLAHAPVAKELASGDSLFRAHVAMYPNCTIQIEKPVATKSPILILLAEKDDWGDAKFCVDLAKKFQEGGTEVETIIYPEAHHGWNLPGPYRKTTGYSLNECPALLSDQGKLTEIKTGKVLADSLSCRKDGVHVGYSQEVTGKADEKTLQFLKSKLQN